MHPLQLFLVPYTLTLVSLQRREVMTDAIYSQEGVGEFLDCFWNHDKSTGRSLLVHMTIWISKFSQCDIDMEQKAWVTTANLTYVYNIIHPFTQTTFLKDSNSLTWVEKCEVYSVVALQTVLESTHCKKRVGASHCPGFVLHGQRGKPLEAMIWPCDAKHIFPCGQNIQTYQSHYNGLLRSWSPRRRGHARYLLSSASGNETAMGEGPSQQRSHCRETRHPFDSTTVALE